MAIDMANQEIVGWASEEIPGQDFLYLRIHEANLYPDGTPNPGAFRNRPDKLKDGMSTDWDKYSNPAQTRDRAHEPYKNKVVKMNVGEVRLIPQQIVKHTPDLENHNRAHTDVFGPKDTEARVLFRRICAFVELPATGV